MLQALHLTKRYPDKTALHDLNLHIEAGEIFCMLGANGAGKTTTINLFMGFAQPTSGKALINGLEVKAGQAETKKLVAYIPENVMLYPSLTGLQWPISAAYPASIIPSKNCGACSAGPDCKRRHTTGK